MGINQRRAAVRAAAQQVEICTGYEASAGHLCESLNSLDLGKVKDSTLWVMCQSLLSS